MFPHSMQITRHLNIYVFSNEALFAKPFQTHHEARQRPILKIGQGKGPFHQNNLKTQSFPQRQKIQNFLVVRISRTKTFQTERVNCFRNKNALRVRKSLLQTCHFYHEFVNFQIVRYLQNLSTFIAIGLSSNHL